MVDMLERMGMIQKVNEEAYPPDPPGDAGAAAPEPPSAGTAAPLNSSPYISPEKEKSMYSHLSVSNTRAFDSKPASSISDGFWDDTSVEESTVDRYLDIDELYHVFRMKTGGIDTIYLIEEYIKTLPDSLPAELRRSIIMRIVASSGFDFEKLLNDGIDRVSRLNEYAAAFAVHTDEIVTRQNQAIEELERQIEAVRQEINERKNLHKKQFLTIENEAQRLKEVLDFITK